jgi:hypothetical protein
MIFIIARIINAPDISIITSVTLPSLPGTKSCTVSSVQARTKAERNENNLAFFTDISNFLKKKYIKIHKKKYSMKCADLRTTVLIISKSSEFGSTVGRFNIPETASAINKATFFDASLESYPECSEE